MLIPAAVRNIAVRNIPCFVSVFAFLLFKLTQSALACLNLFLCLHRGVTSTLIEHKADLEAKDEYGGTALMKAAEGGHE